MRLEHIPVIIGVLLALVGIALLADAWAEDGALVPVERRRRPRTPRHAGGEATIGIGILLVAASMIAQDAWRYGTLAVLLGTGAILVGAVLNRGFIRDAVMNRGAARRSDGGIPRDSRPEVQPEARPANPLRAEPEERRKQPR